jgi:TRAP transporter TAXI family solute receptor
MRSKSPRSVLVMAVVAVLLAACGGRADSPQRRLTIGSGQKGSTFASYGEAMKAVFGSSLPDYRVTITPSNGSPENVRLLARDPNAVGLVHSGVASDAVLGRGEFRQPVSDLRVLANLYTSYIHVVTLPERNIHSFGDLKGKRISVGSKGTGTEVDAMQLLRVFGFDPVRDLKVQRLNTNDSVEQLDRGGIDAFFRTDGIPGPAIAKLAQKRKIVLLPLDEFVRPLQQRYGGGQTYTAATIPAGAYNGVTTPTPTVALPNLLVVNRSMDDDLAYRLTKALFVHKAELAGMEKEARNLDQLTAQEVAPLELHAGAARYYDQVLG